MKWLNKISPRRFFQKKREEKQTRETLTFSYLEYITVLLEKNLYLMSVHNVYENHRNFNYDKYIRKGRSCLDRAWSNYKTAHGLMKHDPRD